MEDEVYLLKCTLCPYKNTLGATFQRHLMKSHGIKLKNLEACPIGGYNMFARVTGDYGLSAKFESGEVYKIQCKRCDRYFQTPKSLKKHDKQCYFKQSRKKRKRAKGSYSCELCEAKFLTEGMFKKHTDICGKANELCCRLCAFRCHSMDKLSRHTIDNHNLIPKLVAEPDYEEALHRTPYTLERAIEVDKLPEVADLAEMWYNGQFDRSCDTSNPYVFEKEFTIIPKPIKGKEKAYPCPNCKEEFSTVLLFHHHKKNDSCSFRSILSK